MGNRVLTYRVTVGTILNLEDKDTTLPRKVGIRLRTDATSSEKSGIRSTELVGRGNGKFKYKFRTSYVCSIVGKLLLRPVQ